MEKKYSDLTKKNNIVKYHNDMNLVQFKDFNIRELNLFYSICSVMRDEDENTVTFGFKFLKNLAQIETQSKDDFVEVVKNMYTKLINLKFDYDDEHRYIKFVLFTAFLVDKDKELVSVKINPDFKYMLNNLTGNFTRFELQEYNNLRSKYSKEFYRNIKRFRTTGLWKIDVVSLKKMLGLPEEFENKYFKKDIFNVVMRELKPLIPGLKIESYKNGRRIAGFNITFKKEAVPKDVKLNKPPVHTIRDAEQILRERNAKEESYKNRFHNFDSSNSDGYTDEFLSQFFENNKR